MNPGILKPGSWVSQVLYALSLVCLGAGLFIMGWTVWPVPNEAVQIPISEGVLPGAPTGTNYASLADYSLNVSWPRWLRSGDVGTIQIALSEAGLEKAEAEVEDVQIVVAEPRLKDLISSPPGTIQANMAPGMDLAMTWDVTAEDSGEYSGKVLVSFGFYNETLDELVVVPVAVVDVLIIITALWGMGSQLAIWFGLVGIVLWGALFLLGRMAQTSGR